MLALAGLGCLMKLEAGDAKINALLIKVNIGMKSE